MSQERLATIDQEIEDAAVRGDLVFLERAYAPDLRYRHANGEVETRSARLANVRRGGYAERTIERLGVEPHGDVGITSGRLVVRRSTGGSEERYALPFVRVYAFRGGRWQLLSHRGLPAEVTS
jgi:hypothetical protein